MKTILAVAALLVAVVVFVPDWIYPEELGPLTDPDPAPEIVLPSCLGCI